MTKKKQNQEECIKEMIAQLADATGIQLYTEANQLCVEFNNKTGIPERHVLDLKAHVNQAPTDERIDFKLEPCLEAFIHDSANKIETNFILERIVLLWAENTAEPELALLIEYWANGSRISLMSSSTGKNLAYYKSTMSNGRLRFYSIDLSGYVLWAEIVSF